MSESVWVLVERSKILAAVAEEEFAQEWIAEGEHGTFRVAHRIPLHRGRAPGIVQRVMARAKRFLPLVVVLALPTLASAQTVRVPAGLTTVTVDITPGGIAPTDIRLEVDGTEQAPLATPGTPSGAHDFAPVPLSAGVHTFRARACTDWGLAFGGLLCSNWTLPMMVEAVGGGTPSTLGNLRITRVVIEVTP